jgi:hypothetical protein
MARLYTDGAESGDLLRSSSYVAGNNTPSVETVKRTGTYGYRMKSASAAAYGYMEKVLPATYTEFYARFAFMDTWAGNVGRIFEWRSDTNEGGSLRIDNYGTAAKVSMYDGTTLRVTSSPINMPINEWHIFEVHVILDASGTFQCKFDGTLVIDYSGDTNAYATMSRFRLSSPNVKDTSYYAHFDDIAFNDTSGSADTGWCGDGGVLAAMVPTGAGTYTDLTASTGAAYTCVDEIPANATDYVYSGVVNAKSVYAMGDLAGLPTGASIERLWVELDALEVAASGVNIATLLRSGTTDSQGTDQALTITYARYLSAEYLTDPADSAPWNSTKVNALQAGAVVR